MTLSTAAVSNLTARRIELERTFEIGQISVQDVEMWVGIAQSQGLIGGSGGTVTATGFATEATLAALSTALNSKPNLTQAEQQAAVKNALSVVEAALGEPADAVGADTVIGKLKELIAATGGGESGAGATTANTSRIVSASDSPDVVMLGNPADAANALTIFGQLRELVRLQTNAAPAIDVGAGATGANTTRVTIASDDDVAIVAGDPGDATSANTFMGVLKFIRANWLSFTFNAGAADTTTLRSVTSTDSPEVIAIGTTTDADTTDTVIGLLKRQLSSAFTAAFGDGAVDATTLRTTQASDSPLMQQFNAATAGTLMNLFTAVRDTLGSLTDTAIASDAAAASMSILQGLRALVRYVLTFELEQSGTLNAVGDTVELTGVRAIPGTTDINIAYDVNGLADGQVIELAVEQRLRAGDQYRSLNVNGNLIVTGDAATPNTYSDFGSRRVEGIRVRVVRIDSGSVDVVILASKGGGAN